MANARRGFTRAWTAFPKPFQRDVQLGLPITGIKESAVGKREDQDTIMHVLIQLAEEENKLTESMVAMLGKTNEMAANRTTNAEVRTTLSQERTQLVRQQTKFSSKSTDLAEQRTLFAANRTGMAEKRTDLAELRTDLSKQRTSLASERNDLAARRTVLSEKRTSLAEERNDLAINRTVLSTYRSVLAKGRTELAFIRTGLALIALGLGLIRYFGLGIWTLLDGSLVTMGVVAALFGTKGYLKTRTYERMFSAKVSAIISDFESAF